jgi:hypothetical protein
MLHMSQYGSVDRRRSRDLFPTDEPVAVDRLIGRADDVDVLANSLTNGLNRVLVGPRRTGKTSVVQAALAEVALRGSYVVALDLFRLSGAAELAEALVRAVLANRSPTHRAGAALRRAGRNLTETASRAVSATVSADLGIEVEIAVTPGVAAKDPQHYLTYALELPQRVAALDGRDVVLFIDEFQEIASGRGAFGPPDRLTKRMRSILQASPSVTTVFAGSIEHAMRDLFTPKERAFYQYGSFETLSPIPAATWRAGIIERLALDGTTIDPLALAELLRRGSGHPRATMLLLQQAHNLAVLLGRHDIDGDLAVEAYAEAMAADSGSHATEVERIRELGRHTFRVCRQLARGQAPYNGEGEASSVHRALERLERAGIVDREHLESGGARGTWQLVDPLLRDYLAALGPPS